MKKILTLIAAAAALAVSCQKEAPETGDSSATGKLTATIVKASTKVIYSETPELNLQPAWEVGDKIIGFDDAGNTYTLTVASVEAETATLSGTVPDGALHLIYKSGAKASDISSKSLAIDYTAQAGDKTMPAVMLADGTVTDGSCDFEFSNAGAIIGISAVKGSVPPGSAISKITIEGSNLSAATVALSGSALALTAATAASDAISTATLSGITTTDAIGTLSSPVFIAVPANASIAKVSVSVTNEPETMTIPSTAADKKDIDYVEIAAKYDGTNVTTKKWAKWNVGANNEKDYGWYFAWAGTEGYALKNGICVPASGVYTYYYTLSSSKTAVASDYLYVKKQWFTKVVFNFGTEFAPYHTGSSHLIGWTKYIPSSEPSYWNGTTTDPDNKLVLDPEDDAATVNWGPDWRMPTAAEFMALYDATNWTWDSTDRGYYVTEKGVTLSDDKSNALLFFPAAGYGTGVSPYNPGSDGNYWSSSLDSYDPAGACQLWFRGVNAKPTLNSRRYFGHTVRPLSD